MCKTNLVVVAIDLKPSIQEVEADIFLWAQGQPDSLALTIRIVPG